MISHGWKSLGVFTASGAAASPTAAVSEVSTSIESTHTIPCSGMSFCLLSYYTSIANTGNVLTVRGTQGSAESSQDNEVFFNHSLVTVTPTTDAALTLPAGAYDTAGVTLVNYQTGSLAGTDTGASNGPIVTSAFLNLQGAKSLQGDNTSGTGDTQTLDPYYANFGDNYGPSWVAVPCGPFDRIQVRYTLAAAGTSLCLACLLS